MEKKLTAVIIQARLNSKRFRGKILQKINNLTLLEILIFKIKKVKNIDQIIVATTKSDDDKAIVKICKKLKIKFFLGSESDVLSRYYFAAKKFKISNIIRVTSDCPLIDIKTIQNLITIYSKGRFQYVSNVIEPSFPDGMDAEVFSFKILEDRYKNSKDKFEKEHVTSFFIKSNKYKKYNLSLKKNYSKLKLSVDNKYDFNLVKKIIKYFKNNIFIELKQLLLLYDKNKNFFEKNSDVTRNLNMNLNQGQKYWLRAKEVIPGGSMLFSKDPDLHLPRLWPAYYSRAKGCKIWDLDNKRYNDIFLMGVGTNTLGYANKNIDSSIIKEIKKSNMSSLNSIDEILLSEKLLDMHQWAEMSRFTRTGGEANAVAIRIARAYSGKDNIAICGYHGWHDWYLASNLKNNNTLNNFLIKNLQIDGVPKRLSETIFTFEYNNYSQLEKIVTEKNIGVIKMEVERNEKPKNNFLKKVRELASKKKIVLIFDECTSGFRSNFGGLHLKYKIKPDMLILGKALGNGYAINAVLGKKDIMQACNKTFISSTFWTERIGYVAANSTLKEMERLKSWEKISHIGRKIKNSWKKIADNNSIKIEIKGLDSLPIFYFNSSKHNLYKTYIAQEMLKKNFLATNVIYTSIAHKEKIIDNYLDHLNFVFKKIKDCENDREDILNLLNTEECKVSMRHNNEKL